MTTVWDRRRWTMCALLFTAATINYLDRQVLAILSATADFARVTGFGSVEYGYANAVFQTAYALGLPLVGRLVDRFGTRRGFMVVMGGWSLAAMAHALARGPSGFYAARFALGLGEAGNFPTAIKTVAEWFPRRERALATGLLNAGTSAGALAAPLLVPWLYLRWGWRGAFIATGLVGFAWLVAWALLTRRAPPPAGERDADAGPRAGGHQEWSWGRVLSQRQTWALALGKFLTDPIWFFYLAWLPRFLRDTQGIRIDTLGLPLATIYLLSDVGSVAGGWLAAVLMRRGWPVARTRARLMLLFALMQLPVALSATSGSLWRLVVMVGLATAAHQAWSANLFSLAADHFPLAAVGRVVGFAGMAGSLGAVLLQAAAGHLVEGAGGYRALLLLAGTVYLGAWGVMRALGAFTAGAVSPPATPPPGHR
jgi:MFS transporter, ACS family, hexuronate transporter